MVRPEKERERTSRRSKRLSREPDADSIPGFRDHDLS